MNNPKYSALNNRNLSPLRGTNKPKYYSAQDVNKIVRNAFQPKILFLTQQLDQRQQIIAKLNNKLNENDQKLSQQSSIIESYLRRQKEIPHMQSYIVSTINQILNDKTKQYWQTIGSHIRQIGAKVQQEFDSKRLEAIVISEMEKVKGSVTEFIDNFKKKSNSYWQKIKEALNKINSKMNANEKDIIDINTKLQNFQAQRLKDRQTINQLQNSKNVVKNLIQLKKSVQNIYQNYQAVLSLQKGLKQKIQQQNGDSLWQEHQFMKSHFDKQYPSQQIVALQYSKQDISKSQIGEHFFDFQKKQNITQPIVSPLRVQQDKSSTDLLQLQRTTPINNRSNDHSDMFSLNTSQNAINSRIQNSTMLINLSLQTRKEMCQGVRQRLIQLIETKHLSKPLEVRYDDQINYLKSAEGNYLFDMKGNMFKTNASQLAKLQEQGLVSRGKSKKHSLSTSKIKRTQC